MVSIEHLRRVWHADRGRLLLRTPGPVPLGLAYVLLVETNPFPNLSLFYRTMLFEYPSVLSRFCFIFRYYMYGIFCIIKRPSSFTKPMLEYVVYYYIIRNLQYLSRNRLCITTSLQIIITNLQYLCQNRLCITKSTDIYNTYAGIGCVLPHYYKFPIHMPELVVYYHIITNFQYLCWNWLCITIS